MTPEEKIAGAAEMIMAELSRRGQHIAIDQAAKIAKQMLWLWSERVQILDMKPGEVAQHHRKRYGHPDNPLPPVGDR